MSYDYKAGKERIEAILNNKMEIIDKDKLPKGEEFTFDNGYKSWITAIFVDIRDSSTLFQEEDSEKVAKIIRSFTSEIIEIFREEDDLIREIGIRGDCVYAIYTTPQKPDIDKIFYKACTVNTYIKMLNKLLINNGYEEIKIGIGMATDKELVIKAGRKTSGINAKVWIGKAVTEAANLSGVANKGLNFHPIAIAPITYNNLNEHNKELCKQDTYYRNNSPITYYKADAVYTDVVEWINNGME
ncbi:adenylate/guanylate cyclase domain-containing protein [Clostridium perfringens]|uniref:adenylate/guanylate cyclase domain-containing protein n=1 Tax=Clostridium perfringens TaxID=1502 RepID=UPI000E4D6A9B|nr:adenylate/guanylate cyclase domain-containing protein [Clostridium perfringens]EHR9039708.1 adenylate/guanylate cyclase domain-containing protein [Clostridium perfringens]RHN23807.1 adenylate cyclase [Clostridium perfringens]